MTPQHPPERLIKQLQTRGIRNKVVLEAIQATPRHLFVDNSRRSALTLIHLGESNGNH